MFEVLDATADDLVAVRIGSGSAEGYEEFYSLLVERTERYGSVRVYEEALDWTFETYLTHLHGILPDLRYGPEFDIGRYVCVGDSLWTRLLYHQWRVVRPVWPVAPESMRYFHSNRRDDALRWVTEAPSRG